MPANNGNITTNIVPENTDAEPVLKQDTEPVLKQNNDIVNPKAVTNENNEVRQINPNDIHVDPARFQFKTDVDKKTGASKELDIKSWDPNLAGIVLVWEDNDGKQWIVNGHHRLQKAKELGIDNMYAKVIREKDGYTPEDARLIGAKVNIAEGHGSLTDAANIIWQ